MIYQVNNIKGEAMENGIFREKSIEKATSPERLDDYVKITTPGVWMVLLSIFILLIGVILWCSFGDLDTVISLLGN